MEQSILPMNLTRDYKFNELYCSTLEQSDIDTANQMGYNMEATKFQYDFLNGDYDVLPERLRTAIDSGKEILFLINPPYQDGSELSINEAEGYMTINGVQYPELTPFSIDGTTGKIYAGTVETKEASFNCSFSMELRNSSNSEVSTG